LRAEIPRPVIHRGLTDVDSITGSVVVIDVFRASNTIISLLAAGASEVLLVADIDEARAIKRRHPEQPLLGERGGLTPSDFDGGNSPVSAPRAVGTGDRPILTTSAGTQAIARLTRAEPVFFASFANAAAVAKALHRAEPSSVTLLPMGLEAREPAVEDDEAALWISELIQGRTGNFDLVRRRLLGCDGARRLRRLGQHSDLEFCARLNSHDIVPLVRQNDPPRAMALHIRG